MPIIVAEDFARLKMSGGPAGYTTTKNGRPFRGGRSKRLKRNQDPLTYFLAGFSGLFSGVLALAALISDTTSAVKSMVSFENTTTPTAFKD